MATSSNKAAKWPDFIAGLGLLLGTGLLDYVTGYKVTVLAFYLLPILFVLKRVGQTAAIVMSVLSGLMTALTDIIAGETYPDILTPIWNTGIRVSLFLLVTSLVATRDELEGLVQQRTRKLQEEMQESERLQDELLAAADREQRRIGHDLHDSLGQHLTATALAGKILSKKLAAKALPEKDAADQLVRMVEDGIELTRQLARSLHPAQMDGDNFIVSLEELAANISKAFGIACIFECPEPLALNNPAANIHIYRIVQEAVSNAIRHGQAKKVTVRLEPAGKTASLKITDDGTGLREEARQKRGMGLRIMEYRANMIGATFNITRGAGGGTQVSCTLPLDWANFEDEK